MDLERNILKALFYDYPVDAVVHLLNKSEIKLQHDIFLDILPQLVQWSKPEYTYTESNLLRIQIGGKWMQNNRSLPTIYHPFHLLIDVADKLLTTNGHQPIVKFEQLFRWKDIALYIGEDLLTTSFIASYDLHQLNQQRKLFVWEDILTNNNKALNNILQKGTADVHAHYNATVDVFNLNWISLMNNTSICKKFDSIYRAQELELLPTKIDYPSSIQQYCVAAAYLRFVLYQMLIKGQCIENGDDEFIEAKYNTNVLHILRDPWYAKDFELKLQPSISWALKSSLPTTDKRYVDYCLLPSVDIYKLQNEKQKVNLLYQGERQLLYNFFYLFYQNDKQSVSIAPYFYLYLLLKTKIRREFIQVNKLKGFENFEEYQDRKDLFINSTSPIRKYFSYCVNYSSKYSDNDHIEARITPKSLITSTFDYNQPIFNIPTIDQPTKNSIKTSNNKNTLVVHFIKKGKYSSNLPTKFNKVGYFYDCTRDKDYRLDIKQQLFSVIDSKKHNIVGIDAASREIFCRPEVFGHVYRFARMKGIKGRTYHVGEDFLDLPDGIRAIDEAINFLELDEFCRIGHAMAVGICSADYYERRHYTTIITKQFLLDECVWLYKRGQQMNVKMSRAFENNLIEKAKTLYDEIGYCKICTWDIETYWQSMLLRGNDPDYVYRAKNKVELNSWEKTTHSNLPEIIQADNENSKDLFAYYFFNKEIIKNGSLLILHKWTKEIVSIVSEFQDKMRREIAKKRICIECCPTSNLKIGYIERYDQHPLITKFYPIDKINNDPAYPLIKSSINTDDRGVFYTSIYEEYSLIALALYKMRNEETNELKFNEREILNYVEEIRQNSQFMAFD